MQAEEIIIDYAYTRSLMWDGDELVDWVSGGTRIALDGSVRWTRVSFEYRFDAAIRSPTGRFVAIYERLGTKAILLDGGKFSREFDRSYHRAGQYEFPITFVSLPDGTEAIAHCPRECYRIDIDDAATGRCLTDSAPRDIRSLYYSRLSANPSATWFASAGWAWGSTDIACVWNVEAALANPRTLDGYGARLAVDHEVEGAAFLNDDLLAVAANDSDEGRDSIDHRLAILNVADGSLLRSHSFASFLGTILPFGPEHALALYDHPRLINTVSGMVDLEWPHLKTGEQASSILRDKAPIPVFAKHPSRPMFAVADAKRVTVVSVT